jgi:hypothetical protein
VKYKVVYAGLRIFNNDSIAQCFVRGKQEYFYKGLKFLILGHAYVAHKDDKRLQMAKRPEHLGEAEIDAETLQLWEDQTSAAEQFARRKRAAAQAKNLSSSLAPHLEPITARYKKLKTHVERDAFISYVSRLIMTGGKG